MTAAAEPAGRVAILAPTGRDARVAADVLGRAGFATLVCADLAAVRVALADGDDSPPGSAMSGAELPA